MSAVNNVPYSWKAWQGMFVEFTFFKCLTKIWWINISVKTVINCKYKFKFGQSQMIRQIHQTFPCKTFPLYSMSL